MKQKIEWYREVLELEPGSRVFFPLAKLLVTDDQPAEAARTLETGLLRHPDHAEARLFLVELLLSLGNEEAAQSEVAKLGDLLEKYPGFWQAWSSLLAGRPSMANAALAVRFLAASLTGRTLDWGAVIERGMAAVLADGAASVAPVASGRLEKTASVASADQARMPAGQVSAPPPDLSPAAEPPQAPFACFEADEDDGAEDEEDGETFSLRTRSMADVLAEQGDLRGAEEIYRELLAGASEEERLDLQSRIDELSRSLQASAVQEAAPREADRQPAGEGGDSSRLVGLLESLAERLESRAR